MGKKISFGHINTDKMSQKNFKLCKQSFLAASLSLALVSAACAPKAQPKLGYAQPMQERIVLGSMMIDESIIEKVDDKLDTDSFISESHRILFDTMVEMNEDEKEVNVESVIRELAEANVDHKVDGYVIVENTKMVIGTDKIGQPIYDNVNIAKRFVAEEYVSYLFATTNAAINIDKYIDEVDERVYLDEAINGFNQPKTLVKTKPGK